MSPAVASLAMQRALRTPAHGPDRWLVPGQVAALTAADLLLGVRGMPGGGDPAQAELLP